MNGIKGPLDSFSVEEEYNWHDDIMEITRRIVHETDKARLNNIAEHFNVDLSEIREFLEMKRKKMQKPQTNADRIRSMTDEELAVLLEGCICPKDPCPDIDHDTPTDKKRCTECWLDWLKQREGE